jgi:hypothetical protein
MEGGAGDARGRFFRWCGGSPNNSLTQAAISHPNLLFPLWDNTHSRLREVIEAVSCCPPHRWWTGNGTREEDFDRPLPKRPVDCFVCTGVLFHSRNHS